LDIPEFMMMACTPQVADAPKAGTLAKDYVLALIAEGAITPAIVGRPSSPWTAKCIRSDALPRLFLVAELARLILDGALKPEEVAQIEVQITANIEQTWKRALADELSGDVHVTLGDVANPTQRVALKFLQNAVERYRIVRQALTLAEHVAARVRSSLQQ